MEPNIGEMAMDNIVGDVANATAKNMTESLMENDEPLVVRMGKFFMNTVINMVWYAGCFAAFMVGTVYFK